MKNILQQSNLWRFDWSLAKKVRFSSQPPPVKCAAGIASTYSMSGSSSFLLLLSEHTPLTLVFVRLVRGTKRYSSSGQHQELVWTLEKMKRAEPVSKHFEKTESRVEKQNSTSFWCMKGVCSVVDLLVQYVHTLVFLSLSTHPKRSRQMAAHPEVFISSLGVEMIYRYVNKVAKSTWLSRTVPLMKYAAQVSDEQKLYLGLVIEDECKRLVVNAKPPADVLFIHHSPRSNLHLSISEKQTF